MTCMPASNSGLDPRRRCESLHVSRLLVEASVASNTPPPRRRDRDHKQATLHKSAYPRSSNGMWSIKLFAPSGTSSYSPSKSGVNTSWHPSLELSRGSCARSSISNSASQGSPTLENHSGAT